MVGTTFTPVVKHNRMSHGGHGHGHSHSHSHGHEFDEDIVEEGMEVLELSCTRGLSSEDALQVREAMRGQQLGRQAASVRSIRDFERECGDLGVPKTSLLSFYGLVKKRRRAFSETDEFPPPPVVRSSSSKSLSPLLRHAKSLNITTPTAE